MQKKFDDENETVLVFEDIIASTHNENIKIWRVRENSEYFALKGILRKFIDTEEQMAHLYNERNSLRKFSHSGIVKLIRTLKDSEYLYLLLELCYGITLDKLLQMNQKFTEAFTKFISIQLILILEYIHSSGDIYRDLKLSNIVINLDGRIKLLDFGFCKNIGSERTSSFCGTTHAMAPEFFDDDMLLAGYSYQIDFYALGILIFEMLTGLPPFGYENKNPDIIKEIKTGIQKNHFSQINNLELIDLLSKLLEKDHEKRLGSKAGWVEIKEHPYFKGVDWKLCEDFMKNNDKGNKFCENTDFENYKNDIEEVGLMPKKVMSDSEKKAQEIFDSLF